MMDDKNKWFDHKIKEYGEDVLEELIEEMNGKSWTSDTHCPCCECKLKKEG